MGDSWFFDRFAPAYDRLMPPADMDAIFAGFGRGAGPVETVLDLAGGSGRIGRELSARFDATVCDLSRPMLEQARRHGLDAVQCDATALPFLDGSIDGIVIADAYHHLVDPGTVLGEAYRVLRPGGVLVVREFDPTTIRGRGIELVEGALGWPCEFRMPGALAEDLDAAGFDALVLEYGFDYTVSGVKPKSSR